MSSVNNKLKSITSETLDKLKVHKETNELYYNGKRIKSGSVLAFDSAQSWLAVIGAIAGIVSILNGFFDFIVKVIPKTENLEMSCTVSGNAEETIKCLDNELKKLKQVKESKQPATN